MLSLLVYHETKRECFVITHFQTIAFSEALYLALPFMQMSWTPEVLSGVGMRTSIFCASRDCLKLVLMTTYGKCILIHVPHRTFKMTQLCCTLTSSLVRPTSLTSGMTRKGKAISFVVRYRISSYSPSGGMKEMACSVSNLDNFTHWWN